MKLYHIILGSGYCSRGRSQTSSPPCCFAAGWLSLELRRRTGCHTYVIGRAASLYGNAMEEVQTTRQIHTSNPHHQRPLREPHAPPDIHTCPSTLLLVLLLTYVSYAGSEYISKSALAARESYKESIACVSVYPKRRDASNNIAKIAGRCRHASTLPPTTRGLSLLLMTNLTYQNWDARSSA